MSFHILTPSPVGPQPPLKEMENRKEGIDPKKQADQMQWPNEWGVGRAVQLIN